VTEGLTKIADLFKFGRSAATWTPIDVSANGTTSVPRDALAEALRARFAELRDADAKATHDKEIIVRLKQSL
jgi:hypothetical protein